MSDSGYGSDLNGYESEHYVEEEVFHEDKTYLILNTTVALKSNVGFTVNCGLNTLQNFTPAVNIVYSQDPERCSNILLDRLEWNELILTFIKWTDNPNSATSTRFLSNQHLTLNTIITLDGLRVVKLSKNVKEFYFTPCDILELIDIDIIVSTKLNLMMNLHICEYYYEFLDYINTLLVRCNYVLNPVDIITSLCSLTFNLETYCIFEFFSFNRDRFLSDLYNRSYF